jgi:hypothetical protein
LIRLRLGLQSAGEAAARGDYEDLRRAAGDGVRIGVREERRRPRPEKGIACRPGRWPV